MSVTLDTIFSDANMEKPYAAVLVPKWGGNVRVYGMSDDEKDAFDRETIRRTKKKLKTRFRARLLIASVCSEDGKPIFTADHEDKLAATPTTITDRPFKAALTVCGYTDEDAEELEAGN